MGGQAMTETKIIDAVARYRVQVREIHRQMAKVGDDAMELRRLAAKIGGVKRRWVTHLIEMLTSQAFKDRSVSREKVRQWQRETFGHAVGSCTLKIYATASRSGGGRSDFAAPPQDTCTTLKETFIKHRDDCLRD
jgi:hypothetical protein